MYEADTKMVLSVTDKALFKVLTATLLIQRGNLTASIGETAVPSFYVV